MDSPDSIIMEITAALDVADRKLFDLDKAQTEDSDAGNKGKLEAASDAMNDLRDAVEAIVP